MAIYDYLPTFNYVEPNNLKGLQPGFVVAQEGRVASGLKDNKGMMENGKICKLTSSGIEAVAASHTGPAFIHYTEPLNTILNSDKYFAVNTNYECPRLVQLIPGDEWTSSKELTTAELMSGRIVKVETCTMANGETGHRYVFLG